MKLITETNMSAISRIIEESDDSGNKTMYISGIFCQSEVKNKNGRVYPRSVLQKAVRDYVANYVNENRALGELNHNQAISVNPERACILIKELKWSGNNVLGRAKVLSTPVGELVKNLINDGVQLGVSTRGVGTLENRNGVSVVNDDYMIGAIDVVSNPSGPSCWVDGILENVEFYVKNGVLEEATAEEYLKNKKTYDMKSVKRDFVDFLKNIKI